MFHLISSKKTSGYPMKKTNDDFESFAFRLTHTIAQLEQETKDGVEDWTPTITRLKEVLAEETA